MDLTGPTVAIKNDGSQISGTHPWVVILNIEGIRHEQGWGNLTVGRSKLNDVVIRDDSVSAFHANIEVNNQGVFITDHQSTNSTLVNNLKIHARERILLTDGSSIQLGKVSGTIRIKKVQLTRSSSVLNSTMTTISERIRSRSNSSEDQFDLSADVLENFRPERNSYEEDNNDVDDANITNDPDVYQNNDDDRDVGVEDNESGQRINNEISNELNPNNHQDENEDNNGSDDARDHETSINELNINNHQDEHPDNDDDDYSDDDGNDNNENGLPKNKEISKNDENVSNRPDENENGDSSDDTSNNSNESYQRTNKETSRNKENVNNRQDENEDNDGSDDGSDDNKNGNDQSKVSKQKVQSNRHHYYLRKNVREPLKIVSFDDFRKARANKK